MTLLQLLISITGFVFLLFAIDARQRSKLNLLHFLVFFGGAGLILYFLLHPQQLDTFGGFFGVARGADLVVYASIIFLAYLFFELLNKINKQDIERTDVVRAVSLQAAWGSLGETSIVFIIPAYNEDETAVKTVGEVLNAGYGVVYIDDGSPRISQVNTLKSLYENKNLVIIKHILNLGQGAALQTGSVYLQKQHPTPQFVVHFDSDGQMQLSDVPVFLKTFQDDPTLDIVLGSRNLGKAENMPLLRRMMKKAARWFMWMMVGLNLTDTHNGFRVMRAYVLPKLRITLNRMAHASEIEHLIAQHKLHYTEVPVHILYTEYSLTKGQKMSGMWKVMKDFLWKVLFYK